MGESLPTRVKQPMQSNVCYIINCVSIFIQFIHTILTELWSNEDVVCHNLEYRHNFRHVVQKTNRSLYLIIFIIHLVPYGKRGIISDCRFRDFAFE